MTANAAPSNPSARNGPKLYSSFHRPQWRITPERAAGWVKHRFRATRGLTSVRALQSNEFALLLSDLDYYHSRRRRYELGLGPEPPPPHEYLLPGREDWGCLTDLVNELYPQIDAANNGIAGSDTAEQTGFDEEDEDEWIDDWIQTETGWR
jgi:hypothetical protein